MKQGWKRPLDTPKIMIERREREGEWGIRRDIEREGDREREKERGERYRERESERESKILVKYPKPRNKA